MKKKVMMKRAAAVAMTGAMVASLAAFPAFAEGNEGDTSASGEMKFKKEIVTDGDTYAPNVTFTFDVQNEKPASGDDANLYFEGVNNGLKFNTITSAPSENGQIGSKRITFEGTYEVDATAFEKPGVYLYTITEVSTNGYTGMVYDTTTYHAQVVIVNGENGAYKCDGVEFYEEGNKNESRKSETITFTNILDDEQENDGTHDVTITKEIEGTMADMSDEFSFTISVSGDEGTWYEYVVTKNGTKETPDYIVANAETATTVTLGDGDSVQIFGLRKDVDKVTVLETDGESKGYTVTVKDKDGSTVEKDGIENQVISDDGSAWTVVNTRNNTTPTGIVMTFAPYVLMLGAAGAAGGMFLRKKKEDF